MVLSDTHILRGDLAAALHAAEQAHRLGPWDGGVAGHLAGLLARTGASERAHTLVQQLQDGPIKAGATLGVAMYHALCSDFEAAADWCQKAVEQRELRVPFLVWSPLLEPLRSSPRWPALAKMMNLPETA